MRGTRETMVHVHRYRWRSVQEAVTGHGNGSFAPRGERCQGCVPLLTERRGGRRPATGRGRGRGPTASGFRLRENQQMPPVRGLRAPRGICRPPLGERSELTRPMCPPPPAHPASDAACRADTPLFAHPWSLVPVKQRRGNRKGRRVLRLRSVLADPLPYVFHRCAAPRPVFSGSRPPPDTSAGTPRPRHQPCCGPPRARTPAPAGPDGIRRHGALPLEPRHPTVYRPEAERILHAPGTGRRPRDDLPATVTPRPGFATLFAGPQGTRPTSVALKGVGERPRIAHDGDRQGVMLHPCWCHPPTRLQRLHRPRRRGATAPSPRT